MVYEDIFDAKNACDHLSGFNVCNRYLVVLYYNANRVCMSITVSVGITVSNNSCRIWFNLIEGLIFRKYVHHEMFPDLI